MARQGRYGIAKYQSQLLVVAALVLTGAAPPIATTPKVLPQTVTAKVLPNNVKLPSKAEILSSRAVPVITKPPSRAAKDPVTRRFELKDDSGKSRFEVTLTASGWVDARALEYLTKTLRIVEVRDRQELAAFRDDKAVLDRHADEILISLKGLDGAPPANFAWLPPAGFELVRPSVLALEAEFVTGLAKQTQSIIPRPPPALGRATAALTGSFTTLTGTIQCRVGTDVRPLPFVAVQVEGQRALANASGVFTATGRFGTGNYPITLVYEAPVVSGSFSTPLIVMDEIQQARSESLQQPTANSSDSTVNLGGIIASSLDCEIFRLGTVVLKDYHAKVGKSPPAGRLRMKRWSAVWDGTPYTYYDHIVLATNFTTLGYYSDEQTRRSTLFHEFGHSLRHVADGDELHWGWDNFRWVYARAHSGCEVFNVQYAFNEGWAQYWGTQSGIPRGGCPTPQPASFLDWNEDLIGRRLVELSNSLCSATNRGECARKMIEVIERNPGTIHSLREFEVKYCELHFAANPQCRSRGVPARPDPASCPPGFHDDGATCRLENILAKPSYGRGVGVLAQACSDGKELNASLCNVPCRAGFSGLGPMCWQNCPSGYRDDGAFCAKPDAYGRGAGYPWQFGDGLDLGNATRRCEADHGAGRCEQNGLIIYPKCRAGFHAVGCCICSPDCPSGMSDIGVSCTKQSYGRGVGTVPTQCQAGMEYDTGFCYPVCRAGFRGVGPVCWGSCSNGFADHGATCYRDPNILVKY